jgi:hypothetical protein
MYMVFKKLWHICCDHCGYIVMQDLAKLAECCAAASQLAILTTQIVSKTLLVYCMQLLIVRALYFVVSV